jgi:hypothetical protein
MLPSRTFPLVLEVFKGRKSQFKEALVALSLGNILFFRFWVRLLDNDYLFWTKNPPKYVLLATLLNVVLLSALILCAVRVSQRLQANAQILLLQFMFLSSILVILLASLNSASPYLNLRVKTALVPCGLLVATAGLLVLLRNHTKRIWEILVACLLISSPFVFMTFGTTVFRLIAPTFSAQFAAKPPAAALPVLGNRPRVLWIIFDEMDYGQAFDHRADSVKLPEFDRLKQQSFFATAAFPPAYSTSISLPALTTGELTQDSFPVGANELMLKTKAAGVVPWSKQPNVFRDAREMGFNVAVSGFYIPYCRIFYSSVTKCFYADADLFGNEQPGTTLLAAWTDQITRALYELPAAVGLTERRFPPHVRRAAFDTYRKILDKGKEYACDPSLGLVMVHLPMPHIPGIYDRQTHSFKFQGQSSYLDNLSLTDRTLGELRVAMEQNGTWDDTVVIVSSDHWWRVPLLRTKQGWTKEDTMISNRPHDHRIPFMIKFSRQRGRSDYSIPFNTLVTRGLIDAILKNEISDAKRASAWIDRNRTVQESPYDGGY